MSEYCVDKERVEKLNSRDIYESHNKVCCKLLKHILQNTRAMLEIIFYQEDIAIISSKEHHEFYIK